MAWRAGAAAGRIKLCHSIFQSGISHKRVVLASWRHAAQQQAALVRRLATFIGSTELNLLLQCFKAWRVFSSHCTLRLRHAEVQLHTNQLALLVKRWRQQAVIARQEQSEMENLACQYRDFRKLRASLQGFRAYLATCQKTGEASQQWQQKLIQHVKASCTLS